MTELLSKAPLFSELGEDERGALLGFLEPRKLEEGSVLFHPGDESSEMYVVIDGVVRIEADGDEIGRAQPGDVLGSLSLVKTGARRCAALAAETTHLLVLTRASYFRLRSDYPALALALQEGIVRQFSGDVHVLLERG